VNADIIICQSQELKNNRVVAFVYFYCFLSWGSSRSQCRIFQKTTYYLPEIIHCAIQIIGFSPYHQIVGFPPFGRLGFSIVRLLSA
jgi:hypothetical protein